MVKDKIVTALNDILREKGGKLLFAAESGSRAWGFSSPDSDYDVRAVYVMPEEWYWQIDENPTDNFTRMLPGDLDINAWELRKALRLFSKCNLSFNEWLGSPVVYYAYADFIGAIRELIPDYFNPCKAVHHYLALARKAYEEQDLAGNIKIKKLFYALRGLAAAKWCAVRRSMPPTAFMDLRQDDIIPHEVEKVVDGLLEIKKNACEGETTLFPPEILHYWNDNVENLFIAAKAFPTTYHDNNQLNKLFYNIVKWKNTINIETNV